MMSAADVGRDLRRCWKRSSYASMLKQIAVSTSGSSCILLGHLMLELFQKQKVHLAPRLNVLVQHVVLDDEMFVQFVGRLERLIASFKVAVKRVGTRLGFGHVRSLFRSLHAGLRFRVLVFYMLGQFVAVGERLFASGHRTRIKPRDKSKHQSFDCEAF